MRDIAAGTTVLATPDTPGGVLAHDLSGNGPYGVFATGTSLVGASGRNNQQDVYRRDLQVAPTSGRPPPRTPGPPVA